MRSSGFHCGRRRAAAALAVASAAVAIMGPAAAGAATSKYPSAAARGFGEGASGWSSSTSAEGVCLAPVLCARVENSAEASGGADGGGFIRSAYTGAVGASAVGGTTSGIWESPSFVYAGAAGEEAKGVASASTAAPASTSCSPSPATRPNTPCG